MFSFVSLCKHVPPWQAQFWPQRHNLNKLDSGLLDDDTYFNIKALVLVVSDKKNFKGA